MCPNAWEGSMMQRRQFLGYFTEQLDVVNRLELAPGERMSQCRSQTLTTQRKRWSIWRSFVLSRASQAAEFKDARNDPHVRPNAYNDVDAITRRTVCNRFISHSGELFESVSATHSTHCTYSSPSAARSGSHAGTSPTRSSGLKSITLKLLGSTQVWRG
ncbi:hypothetical protein GY45DRAFT_488799 [Cubamyces sp. BRFM 1775]|nr:hypothetical protein GY45DRAFT_488799 [Cubamyces sp. BRFM 1775]